MTFVEQQPGYGPPAPVPVFQWEKEFEVLLELYRRIQPDALLEVGTYHGGTLYHWLRNCSWWPAKIVTVDTYAVGVDNRHLYQDWNVNNVDLVVVEGNSNTISTASTIGTHGPYDMVFIDAGHYLEEVRRDWQLYRPMVAEDGILCFHDIIIHPSWPSIEVGQLWEEIKATEKTFEIVADWDAGWGGIGVVLL